MIWTSASNKEYYHLFLLGGDNFHSVQHLNEYPKILNYLRPVIRRAECNLGYALTLRKNEQISLSINLPKVCGLGAKHD